MARQNPNPNPPAPTAPVVHTSLREGMLLVTNAAPTFVELGPHPKHPSVVDLRFGPGESKELPEDYLRDLHSMPKGPGLVFRQLQAAGKFRVRDLAEVPRSRAAGPLEDDTPRVGGPVAPPSLDAFATPGALALVAAEDDKDVLRMWLAAERREEVLEALRKRLA